MGEHFLIAVDGSDESKKAFAYVLDKHPESVVTLIHVVDPADAWTYGGEEYFDLEGYQREKRRRHEEGEQMLEEYQEKARTKGVEAESVLATGQPAKRILEAAESHNVDHIVMGSRGRSGVGRILFGSVAEEVTRRANVPVTIVR